MFTQDLDVVLRYIATSRLVSIRRPIKIGEVDLEVSELFGYGVNDFDTSVNDFRTDSVRADLSNLVKRFALSYECKRISSSMQQI